MSMTQDLRFALRSLRARSGTACFAVLTLAIGLGAAIAIYAVIDAVLLRDLPYPQPDRLVQLRELAADGHTMAMTYPNYADLTATVDAFDASAFYASFDGPVTNSGNTVRALDAASGGDFFRVFGVAPLLGRTFGAGEHDKVAVISYGLWQGLLHGRADVLGQPLDINGEGYTVIGVMPRDFAFPQRAALWSPLLALLDDPGTSRSAHNFEAVARLGTAGDLARARLAANALAGRIKHQYGDADDAVGFDLTPLGDAIAAPVRSALLLLAAGTAFLLLIAITNATNLLLALNGSRARELAVRAALGASATRLARQIFAESALIAGSACVLGFAGAAVAVRLLVHGGGAHLPRLDEIGIGPGVAIAGVLAAFATALITTAAVLWSNRRRAPIAELRESGRGQSPGRTHLRLRASLLIGQTALTTVLLVGAGLLGRSFLALLAVDPGFNAQSAMSVELSRPWTQDPSAAAETARRYDAVMRGFATLPGVDAVGGVNSLPLTADGGNGSFWDGSVTDVEHATSANALGYAEFRVATPDYFKAAGIRLLRGRSFDQRDRPDGEHVAVVSAAAAHAAWGNADPIGRRIQFGNMDGDLRVLTIVGVVGDVHERHLDRAPMGTVYVDLDQRPMAAAVFDIVVRSKLPLAALAGELRGDLQRLAGDIPYRLSPLAEVRATALADRRFSLVLLGAFSAVAFALAIGGLYGLMAFAVGQRQHEFALRQALGSSRQGIARLVLGGGLRIGGAGIALGLIASLVGAHAARSLLYGVPADDPWTLLGVSALLLVTLLLACLLPARRACAVAPREALS